MQEKKNRKKKIEDQSRRSNAKLIDEFQKERTNKRRGSKQQNNLRKFHITEEHEFHEVPNTINKNRLNSQTQQCGISELG